MSSENAMFTKEREEIGGMSPLEGIMVQITGNLELANDILQEKTKQSRRYDAYDYKQSITEVSENIKAAQTQLDVKSPQIYSRGNSRLSESPRSPLVSAGTGADLEQVSPTSSRYSVERAEYFQPRDLESVKSFIKEKLRTQSPTSPKQGGAGVRKLGSAMTNERIIVVTNHGEKIAELKTIIESHHNTILGSIESLGALSPESASRESIEPKDLERIHGILKDSLNSLFTETMNALKAFLKDEIEDMKKGNTCLAENVHSHHKDIVQSLQKSQSETMDTLHGKLSSCIQKGILEKITLLLQSHYSSIVEFQNHHAETLLQTKSRYIEIRRMLKEAKKLSDTAFAGEVEGIKIHVSDAIQETVVAHKATRRCVDSLLRSKLEELKVFSASVVRENNENMSGLKVFFEEMLAKKMKELQQLVEREMLNSLSKSQEMIDAMHVQHIANIQSSLKDTLVDRLVHAESVSANKSNLCTDEILGLVRSEQQYITKFYKDFMASVEKQHSQFEMLQGHLSKNFGDLKSFLGQERELLNITPRHSDDSTMNGKIDGLENMIKRFAAKGSLEKEEIKTYFAGKIDAAMLRRRGEEDNTQVMISAIVENLKLHLGAHFNNAIQETDKIVKEANEMSRKMQLLGLQDLMKANTKTLLQEDFEQMNDDLIEKVKSMLVPLFVSFQESNMDSHNQNFELQRKCQKEQIDFEDRIQNAISDVGQSLSTLQKQMADDLKVVFADCMKNLLQSSSGTLKTMRNLDSATEENRLMSELKQMFLHSIEAAATSLDALKEAAMQEKKTLIQAHEKEIQHLKESLKQNANIEAKYSRLKNKNEELIEANRQLSREKYFLEKDLEISKNKFSDCQDNLAECSKLWKHEKKTLIDAQRKGEQSVADKIVILLEEQQRLMEEHSVPHTLSKELKESRQFWENEKSSLLAKYIENTETLERIKTEEMLSQGMIQELKLELRAIGRGLCLPSTENGASPFTFKKAPRSIFQPYSSFRWVFVVITSLVIWQYLFFYETREWQANIS
eukprot:Stramenopile-MAST_4_protein_1853